MTAEANVPAVNLSAPSQGIGTIAFAGSIGTIVNGTTS